MKTKKLSSIFLCFLLVFTLLIAAGCEKQEEDDNKKDPEIVDNDSSGENNSSPANNENTNENNSDASKTVKLLKRNGVEWKENTRINSKRGDKSYKVVWGDTLSLIARTWHVNCYKLARYNGIKNIDLIEVDQIIYNYAAY